MGYRRLVLTFADLKFQMVDSDPHKNPIRVPLRIWPPLSEAVALVADALSCPPEEAWLHIRNAILDEVTRLRGTFFDEPHDRLCIEPISSHRVLNSEIDWQSNFIQFHEPLDLADITGWSFDDASNLEIEIEPVLERIAKSRVGSIVNGSAPEHAHPISGSGLPTGTDMHPGRTGYPGRPSVKLDIFNEFLRRAEAEELLPTLAEEARALHDWANKHFSKHAPKPETIETQIRTHYWRARNRNAEPQKSGKPRK